MRITQPPLWRMQEGAEGLVSRCNTVASPTENGLAFATLLQIPRKTGWCLQHRCKSHGKQVGVCNSVASPTENRLVFATVLQVPRKTGWRLQHCCKSHGKQVGVCNSVASPTENRLAFATLLQVPRKTGWCLQHCCKHFQKRREHRKALKMCIHDSAGRFIARHTK